MINQNKDKAQILSEISELFDECGSMIDAIMEVCTRYSIEVETISQYIKSSKEFKEKVRIEGIQLRMLKYESI